MKTVTFNNTIFLFSQGDLDRSVLFYESALAIDSEFEEAKTNLRTLICHKILAEPKKYKKPGDKL